MCCVEVQHMVPPLDEQLHERLQGEVASWGEQSVSSFVDGSLAPLPVDWSRFGDANRFVEIDALRRRWPDYMLMDFHLVRCSHEWMPPPDEAQSPEERASVVQFWRVALEVVAARPRADLQRRDQQYPHEDEVWVLENVAAVVLQLRPNENPEQFWTALIDLHSEAHDWPEQFLTALHRRALATEETPATYAPLLREIARRAFSDVDGERRWPWHEEVWDALIGIDYWVSDLWSDRHADHVLRIWDVISLWMENAPQEGRRLGKFARWSRNPRPRRFAYACSRGSLRSFSPGKRGPSTGMTTLKTTWRRFSTWSGTRINVRCVHRVSRSRPFVDSSPGSSSVRTRWGWNFRAASEGSHDRGFLRAHSGPRPQRSQTGNGAQRRRDLRNCRPETDRRNSVTTVAGPPVAHQRSRRPRWPRVRAVARDPRHAPDHRSGRAPAPTWAPVRRSSRAIAPLPNSAALRGQLNVSGSVPPEGPLLLNALCRLSPQVGEKREPEASETALQRLAGFFARSGFNQPHRAPGAETLGTL